MAMKRSSGMFPKAKLNRFEKGIINKRKAILGT